MSEHIKTNNVNVTVDADKQQTCCNVNRYREQLTGHHSTLCIKTNDGLVAH